MDGSSSVRPLLCSLCWLSAILALNLSYFTVKKFRRYHVSLHEFLVGFQPLHWHSDENFCDANSGFAVFFITVASKSFPRVVVWDSCMLYTESQLLKNVHPRKYILNTVLYFFPKRTVCVSHIVGMFVSYDFFFFRF